MQNTIYFKPCVAEMLGSEPSVWFPNTHGRTRCCHGKVLNVSNVLLMSNYNIVQGCTQSDTNVQ